MKIRGLLVDRLMSLRFSVNPVITNMGSRPDTLLITSNFDTMNQSYDMETFT
jgi:hypothetical protein